jgi:hypothetical protein
MIKILKNTTVSDISISDTGITILASPGTYTIQDQDFLLWSASTDVIPYVLSGDLVVNDGNIDYLPTPGVAYLKLEERIRNVIRVSKNPAYGDFSSIAPAIASLTGVSPTNPYAIEVGPGTYTDVPFALVPGLSIVGLGDRESTILQPSDLTNHFITAVEDSFVRNLTIKGPTTAGKASVYMSSSTATDAKPCWLQRIVFGAADTIMLVSAVNNDNTLSMSDCRLGTGPFNNGFKATTTGTGKGRILGFQISCGDLVTPLPNYIGYASGSGCVINFSTGRYRSSTVTSGSCFQADNGAQLKLLGLSFIGFGKGVHLINSGSAPKLDAIGCTFQMNGNTVDLQIDHPTSSGDVSSCIITRSKIVNNAPNTILLGYQDPVDGDINCSRISATRGFATDLTNITTSGVVTQIVSTDAHAYVANGTALGEILQLPNATTLRVGHQYWIINESTQLITIRQFGGSNPVILSPGASFNYALRDNSTSAGIWSRSVTVSSLFNGSTTALAFYNANANTGRYLEIFPASGSDESPLFVPSSSLLLALTLGSTSISTGTVGIFKTSDLVNPIASISLTGQLKNKNTALAILLNADDEIAVRVTSGSINKPRVAIYLTGA